MSAEEEVKQGSTPKEAAPAHEPTADAGQVEKAVEAVADAIGGVGAQLYFATAVLILIFVVIGTPVTWIYKKDPKAVTETFVTLWKTTVSHPNTGMTHHEQVSDMCTDLKDRFRAAEAFSIISIGFALVGVAITFMNMKLMNQLKVPAVAVSALVSLSTIITWAVMANVYTGRWCNKRSLYDQNYSLYAGAGLFICAWILTIVGPVFAFVNPSAPAGDARVGFANNVNTLAMLIAFSFSLAGTCSPWFVRIYSSVGNVDYTRTSFSLWAQTDTNAENKDTTVMFKDMRNCDDFVQMWFAASGFAVISIIFSFFGLIACVYATVTKKSLTKISIALGVLTSFFTLVTWAIAGKIYYGRYCNQLYYLNGNMYTFQAGFALFVVAWVVISVATILLIGSYVLSKDSPFANSSRVGLLFAAMLLASLVFCIVGSATNVAEYKKDGIDNSLTWWQLSEGTSTTYTETSIGDLCKDHRERVRAGEAFSILSCIFTFAAFIIAVVRLLNRNELRVPASGVAIFASVCQLITWAVGATLYNQSFCGESSMRTQGWSIGAGLALYVTAWCVTLTFSVVNIAME